MKKIKEFELKLFKDHEAIISIQEKIIKVQEFNIKKEMKINELLYDKYLDVMEENGNWKYCYQKLNKKWLAVGVYVRDRRIYMREYMKKKRANGQIKHWREYEKEKIMKGKSEKKNKRGSKTK